MTNFFGVHELFLHLCKVKFIEFAFRLGVVFAIFGFLWGIFQIALSILRGTRPKTVFEEYALKFVQYFFLVDVTFLFCVEKENESGILINELVLAGFILLLYFVGKFQKQQQRFNVLQFAGNRLPNFKALFNLKAEIIAITFSIAVFTSLIFFPEYAKNPISSWFYVSILDIESTPIFGFIFKIIGFFVLLSILLKLVNGFSFLLSGAPFMSVQREFNAGKKDKNKDDFDDFEEVN